MVVKGLYDPAEKKRESGKGNRLGGRPKGLKQEHNESQDLLNQVVKEER